VSTVFPLYLFRVAVSSHRPGSHIIFPTDPYYLYYDLTAQNIINSAGSMGMVVRRQKYEAIMRIYHPEKGVEEDPVIVIQGCALTELRVNCAPTIEPARTFQVLN